MFHATHTHTLIYIYVKSYIILYTYIYVLRFTWFTKHGLTYLTKRRTLLAHDDVIKWKHFPRNWPFVREIHRSPVNFPHKGQWRGALMFSLIYVWINDWVNNREAGDLRRQHGHYDVIVMGCRCFYFHGLILPTWMHLIRSMDKYSHIQKRVWWNYSSIPKF